MSDYPGPETEIGQKRMAEDAEFLSNPGKWSTGATCCVKEQPWVKANGRRFGLVRADDMRTNEWVVYPDGEEPERFASLGALVKVWSVD